MAHHSMLLPLLFAVLTVSVYAVTCPPGGKPRVRREWRTLPNRIRIRYRNAVRIMTRLSSEEGKKHYGPGFMNYRDLVMQHACLNVNPKCDVGHFGPNFGFVHRALMLQFENCLLTIDPKIGALPYWNFALDSTTGKYRNNPNRYIFSSNHFGSYIGDPARNYAVTNGIFRFFRVPKYDFTNKAESENRCVREGWMKSPPASTCTRCCGRGPECVCSAKRNGTVTYLRGTDECSPFTTRNYNQYPLSADGSRHYLYTEQDFEACTDSANILSITDWQRCIESERPACYFPGANTDISGLGGNPAFKTQALNYLNSQPSTCEYKGYYHTQTSSTRKYVNSMHINVHYKIAGELLDRQTAPNDPIFYNFHANVDRSLMTWQVNAEHLSSQHWMYPSNQTVASRDDQGGFSAPYSVLLPTLCSVVDRVTYPDFDPFTQPWLPGTLLDNVVNDGFPFRNLFGDGSGKNGHTFREIIAKTAPGATLYTYDTLEHLYDGCW